MEMKDIVSLPQYIHVVLVSGYIGYAVAYSGYREKERKDDLLYGVLAFGLFGYGFYEVTKNACNHVFWPFVGAILSSLLVACLWRKYLRNWWSILLHKARISNEDGIKSVWDRIIQDTHIAPTQILVYHKDGTRLECQNVTKYYNSAIPTYYTDTDGNIAMYIDKITKPDGSIEKLQHVRDKHYGDVITYIPKTEISRVAIRFLKQ